ncbi:hypothetical protein V499_05252, partial [Pseudogymnoascus sp. VKM F-103]
MLSLPSSKVFADPFLKQLLTCLLSVYHRTNRDMAKLSLLLLAAGLISTTLSQSLLTISRTAILDPPATCTPTPTTILHTTTYTLRHATITSTVTSVSQAPHSCYTATEVASKAFCPLFNSATCGPHPDCIVLKTETVP